MNFYETHFNDYLCCLNKYNIHEYLTPYYTIFFNKPANLIIFSPPSTGKYSQALKFISFFSPSSLKYEKKLIILSDKVEYNFKLSDIHIEVDMSTLGCNSKIIWNEFSSNLQNILYTNKHSIFFILCKNFHKIHNELHDVFYSYMQSVFPSKCKLYFIMLTEHISHINNYIISSSYVLALSAISKTKYTRLNTKYKVNKNLTLQNSLKTVKANVLIDYDVLFNTLFNCITSKTVNFFVLRNILYDILIYNIDLSKIISFVIEKFFILYPDKFISINFTYHIFDFYWHYNNNYRPIYHLENFFLEFMKENHRLISLK